MQMLFTAMLIDALHAAFEDTEIAFAGVAVDRLVGELDILPRAVSRGSVTSALQPPVPLAARLVRHHACDRQSPRLNSAHSCASPMPVSARHTYYAPQHTTCCPHT